MSIILARDIRYYDGKTATPHNVTLHATGSFIEILDQNETQIARWKVSDIKVIEKPTPPIPGKLGYAKQPHARIMMEDDKAWKYITSKIKSENKPMTLPTSVPALVALAVIAVAVLAFSFLGLPRLMENAAYLIPDQTAKAIGKNITDSMISSYRVCNSPKGEAALQKLVNRISENTSRDIKYNVRVVDEASVPNAFAAPGGYIIIYKAVLDSASGPDDVAGVLAHEMSHVDLYHASKSLVRNVGFSAMLAMMLGDASVVKVAGMINQLHFSREDETEADEHAVKLLEQAKIDPNGLANFFESILRIQGDIDVAGLLGYLSTHPETKERIQNIKKIRKKRLNYTPAITPNEWKDLQNICN